MHPLARAFIQRVAGDTDDFDVQLRLRPAAPADVLAERALIREVVLGEAAVDDGDAAPVAGVVGNLLGVALLERSRPSTIGICIVEKYSGESEFMNACMSSPSVALCPSTAIELSHSSPERIGTLAWPTALMPGIARRRSIRLR